MSPVLIERDLMVYPLRDSSLRHPTALLIVEQVRSGLVAGTQKHACFAIAINRDPVENYTTRKAGMC